MFQVSRFDAIDGLIPLFVEEKGFRTFLEALHKTFQECLEEDHSEYHITSSDPKDSVTLQVTAVDCHTHGRLRVGTGLMKHRDKIKIFYIAYYHTPHETEKVTTVYRVMSCSNKDGPFYLP